MFKLLLLLLLEMTIMTSFARKTALLSLILLFSFDITSAQSWYDNEWQYRKLITIDYTKVGSTGAPHSNFAVLVSLTSDTALTANAQADGDDILFTSSDGITKLDYDRESYSSGTLVAWVEIPSLSASANTAIYMYYGNGSASDQQNKTSAWKSNYKSVWHLDNNFLDATSNDYDLTNSGTSNATGKMGNGRSFDGNDKIYKSVSDYQSSDTKGTISVWFKTTDRDITLFSSQDQGTNWKRYLFFYIRALSGNGLLQINQKNDDSQNGVRGSTNVSDNNWHHASLVSNGSAWTIYYDGNAQSLSSEGGNTGEWFSSTTLRDNISLGVGMASSEGNWFIGSMDEVRVSDTCFSAGWILTEYNNQNSPGTFYTVNDQEGWYSTNWNYRKAVTIDYTKVSATGAPHINFPMLLTLTSDSDLSSNAQADGDDILFTSANGTTVLDYDREGYASGTLTAWVEIPSLSASENTIIYMYYGNSGASDQQNKTGTWNSNFTGVWHMEEDQSGTGTTGVYQEATSNNNDGDDEISANGQTGKFGNGQEFDGNDDYINIGDPAGGEYDFGATDDYTISGWVNSDNFANRVIVGKKGQYFSNSPGYLLLLDNSNPYWGLAFTLGDGSNYQFITTAASLPMTLSTWHYFAVTVDGGDNDITFYLDDDTPYSTSLTATGSVANSLDLSIGQRDDATWFWDGHMDEIRIANTARSAGWLQTEYNNQNSPGTFYSLGGEDVLPVELLYFKAEQIDHKGILSWATASEQDNEFFTIEKSEDGMAFSNIGTVKGAGNSLQLVNYSFTDEDLFVGTNYYRLKQTDFNGASSFSQIVVLNRNEHNVINKIYPIPASEEVTMVIDVVNSGLSSIELYDMAGTTVYSKEIHFKKGKNSHTFKTVDLSPGIYIIRYTNSSESVYKKIRIAH